MNDAASLQHTRWECKYHLVFIPKCRRRKIYEYLRKELGGVFRELARQKGSKIEEGHLWLDHVHMMVSIPPKYSISQVVGFMKGKSAIWVARRYGRKRNFTGEHFWARGYYVSTVGRDENAVREYIKNQEEADKRLDQLTMFQ
jgi:putative transposase